jgi:hypothetical protein
MGRLLPHLQGAHCLAMERQRPLKRPWRASGGDLSERLGLGRSEGLGSWPEGEEGGDVGGPPTLAAKFGQASSGACDSNTGDVVKPPSLCRGQEPVARAVRNQLLVESARAGVRAHLRLSRQPAARKGGVKQGFLRLSLSSDVS